MIDSYHFLSDKPGFDSLLQEERKGYYSGGKTQKG